VVKGPKGSKLLHYNLERSLKQLVLKYSKKANPNPNKSNELNNKGKIILFLSLLSQVIKII
jgi:hypothetical protein